MKNIPGNKKILIAALVVVLVSITGYTYLVKKFIVGAYSQQYHEIAKRLEPEKQKTIDEALRHIEKGEIFEAQEHDTTDFMHTDYFGEPWRIWANTFVIWGKARNLFILFMLILAAKPYISRSIDRLNIANLKAKGINAKQNDEIVNF
ncbi:MAG: hypothetical protein LWY06_02415 [Firmicutes bacterium]|nr:hypothetical protein [Bacillota bacterium]